MLVGLQPIYLLNVLGMSSKSFCAATLCYFKKSKFSFRKTSRWMFLDVKPAHFAVRHMARGQSQGQKKNPRPRTAFPRTDPFEAKDRNVRGQGQECSRPRTQAQFFSKKKCFFKRSQKKRSSKKVLLVLELRSRGFYV